MVAVELQFRAKVEIAEAKPVLALTLFRPERRKKGKGRKEGRDEGRKGGRKEGRKGGREEDKEGRGRGRRCVDVFSHRPG